MIIHRGIASNEILSKFKNILGRTLMNNASNTCNIEQHISVASVFWPEIVDEDGCIFISEFYNGNIDSFRERYGNNRKDIEMFVNSWSLSDFFLMSWNNSINDDDILNEFGKILCFFWKLRIKELYPERNVIVELGDSVLGERGLTITMYQA